MRERPIQDLVDGLVQLGVDAKCPLGTGCPPVEVNAQGLPSGKVRLDFVNGLLQLGVDTKWPLGPQSAGCGGQCAGAPFRQGMAGPLGRLGADGHGYQVASGHRVPNVEFNAQGFFSGKVRGGNSMGIARIVLACCKPDRPAAEGLCARAAQRRFQSSVLARASRCVYIVTGVLVQVWGQKLLHQRQLHLLLLHQEHNL
eukprot:1144916-Pelagomonas_calceolata.AAC.15